MLNWIWTALLMVSATILVSATVQTFPTIPKEDEMHLLSVGMIILFVSFFLFGLCFISKLYMYSILKL